MGIFNIDKPKVKLSGVPYDENPDKFKNLKRTLRTDASRAASLGGTVIALLTLTINVVTLFSKSPEDKPKYDDKNNNYKNKRKYE